MREGKEREKRKKILNQDKNVVILTELSRHHQDY